MEAKHELLQDEEFAASIRSDLRQVQKLLPKILDAQDEQEKKIMAMVEKEMSEICRLLYQN